MHKVSIIIPVYNSRNYIQEAVESALNQTYENLEVIIVDDGSTDGTSEILDVYAKNSKIKYIYQKNAGPPSARNTGVKNSSGDFIAFLDSDDVWLKEKIQRQIDFIKSHDVSAVICKGTYLNDNRPLREYFPHQGIVDLSSEVYNGFKIWPSSLLLKKSVLDSVGFFDEELIYCDDMDFSIRLARNHSFGCIGECLYKRRIHPENLTASLKNKTKYFRLLYKKNIHYCRDEQKIILRRTIAKYLYISARKYMFSNQLREGLSSGLASARMDARYLLKFPGLLLRYVRLNIKSNHGK